MSCRSVPLRAYFVIHVCTAFENVFFLTSQKSACYSLMTCTTRLSYNLLCYMYTHMWDQFATCVHARGLNLLYVNTHVGSLCCMYPRAHVAIYIYISLIFHLYFTYISRIFHLCFTYISLIFHFWKCPPTSTCGWRSKLLSTIGQVISFKCCIRVILEWSVWKLTLGWLRSVGSIKF